MSFRRSLHIAHTGRRNAQCASFGNHFTGAVILTAQRLNKDQIITPFWLTIALVLVALSFTQLGADMASGRN